MGRVPALKSARVSYEATTPSVPDRESDSAPASGMSSAGSSLVSARVPTKADTLQSNSTLPSPADAPSPPAEQEEANNAADTHTTAQYLFISSIFFIVIV